MSPWYFEPHTGGNKIPPKEQSDIIERANKFAISRPWHVHTTLKLRFKGQFCYVDELKNGEEQASPLCRIRYFSPNNYSLALYTYSNERYEPCIFGSGKQLGTIEEAIAICALYLN